MDKKQAEQQKNIQEKIQEKQKKFDNMKDSKKEKAKEDNKEVSEQPEPQPNQQSPQPNQPSTGGIAGQTNMFMDDGLGNTGYREPPKENIEDIPKNQPIFPGGPTRNKVEEWKAKYGEIFSIEFGDDTFIYRSINRMEYKNILNTEGNATRFWREERMTELAILWPEDYDNNDIVEGKAGVPTVLSEWIMRSSGFEASSGPRKL